MDPSQNKPKKIVVLSDGTWCGRETGTKTNIWLLAEAIGIELDSGASNSTATSASTKGSQSAPEPPPGTTFFDERRGISAVYFPGCGLGDTFLNYLWNGGTGGDIGKECVNAYKFIVDNYDEDSEIWLFGHSRGSYTVRCVGGMINNCGIIRPRSTDAQTALLCQVAYQIYRSPWAEDHPNSPKMRKFRHEASWPIADAPPIKFMSLIDTVGSLGIPKLNAGTGFEWLEFYDLNVSGDVEKVYHACALHDRLWAFEPCRALRDPKHADDARLEIHERWFAGCHYDVGRQKFRFFRSGVGVNVLEKWLGWLPNILSKPVQPNEVLADLVLLWMLEAVHREDSAGTLIRGIKEQMWDIRERLRTANPRSTGSGDVYGNPWDYAPAGGTLYTLQSRVTGALDWLTPNLHIGTALLELLGVKSLLNILMATRDRRIPEASADTFPLRQPLTELGGANLVQHAGLERAGPGAYGSRTYEAFQSYLLAIRDINEKTWKERTGGRLTAAANGPN